MSIRRDQTEQRPTLHSAVTAGARSDLGEERTGALGGTSHSVTDIPPAVDLINTRRRMRRGWLWAARFAVLIAGLAVWQLIRHLEVVSPLFLPYPLEVWEAFLAFYESGRMTTHTWATVKAVGLALLIGLPLGALSGFFLAAMPRLDDIVSPFLVPLNSVPRLALAPLFILWFGLTITSKVVLAVSLIFFMLLFNTRAAVKSVEPDLIVVARLLGHARRALYWRVIVPASVPAMFAGIRLAITYAFLGVIASEMIAARDGLGQMLLFFSGRLQVDGVFAVLFVMVVLATAVGRIAERVERWLLRWQ